MIRLRAVAGRALSLAAMMTAPSVRQERTPMKSSRRRPWILARHPEPALRRFGKLDAACAGFVLILTALHVAYYFPRVVDDLFISLRYAHNLARGAGAVYNPGEQVEGFSSPLWMLLQAAGIRAGLEGVTWTKALGIGSLLWLEWSLFRLARERFSVRSWLAWLPSLACAGNSYVVNWAVLGLETPLHLALIAAALVVPPAGEQRSSRLEATAVFVGLGLSRPESALYLAAIAAAPFVFARSRAQLDELAQATWRLFRPAALVLVSALAIRIAYYGDWLPNTGHVKAGAQFFDWRHLAPLVAQGAGTAEAFVYVAGTCLLFHQGVRHRHLAAAFCSLACLCFTALVKLDWMPSLRHLLPVTVLAPVGIASFAEAMRERGDRRGTAGQLAAVAAVILSVIRVVQIDNRNSPEENRGRGWIRAKSLAKWQDTVLAYRRVEPPHVRRMGKYEMGQITQAWHILEASAAPIDESWFIGRDIGAVGYYTGVRVFDTAGLFTPLVSRSSAWVQRGRVSDELIRAAMARRPLAGEIYEGWERALGRHPALLRGYRIRRGNPQAPVAFLAMDREKPESAAVIERYRQMSAKFPQLYHLHTLYGESVGAVIEKRLRIVQSAR